MDDAETRAWIFLSFPEKPAPIEDVLAIADGINHAIPTEKELRKSFSWLQKQGLVCRKDRKYFLTSAGLALRRGQRSSVLMRMWDDVAEHFRRHHANI